MSSIGGRIRLFGEVAFEKQRRFAEAMEMAPGNLMKYLNDDSEPGTPILRKLWILGCSTEWVLYNEGEMYANNEAGRLLKEKINLQAAEQDREKNIQESIEAARVEVIGEFPKKAGEAILNYDRKKAAATPQAPKKKK